MMVDCSYAKVVWNEHPQLLTTTDAAKRDQNLVVAADHSDRHSANVVTKQWTRANSIISIVKHDLQNYVTKPRATNCRVGYSYEKTPTVHLFPAVFFLPFLWKPSSNSTCRCYDSVGKAYW